MSEDEKLNILIVLFHTLILVSKFIYFSRINIEMNIEELRSQFINVENIEELRHIGKKASF